MSGICGICEPGRELSTAALQPMLEALAWPGEPTLQSSGGRSAAMGAASLWPFQQVGSVNGVRIAVEADLCNAAELVDVLAREGIDAAGLSLAEQLACLYARRGPEFVKLLDGQFSLALWDEGARRLLLAIDRLGIRSLYWRREGDRLLFASRLDAIRAAQSQPAEPEPAALVQYLLLSAVPAPMTAYRGTQKLSPGTMLVYENGRVESRQYWEIRYPESDNRSVEHWSREVREGMRAAVRRHLLGCAPQNTGAYLSGGTDSSSVVAFMGERFSPVNTFSISFQEESFNEISFARTTADHFGTKHYERCVSPQDAVEAIGQLVRYYDEPFANSSAVGAYYCACLARENGVDALLAGDGGDEIFAGNERYASDKRFALYHHLPWWLRRGLIEPVVGLFPANGGPLGLPRRYIRRASIPNPKRIISYNLFLTLPPEQIFAPEFLHEVPAETWLDVVNGHFHLAPASSELNRLLYLDMKVTIADNDVRKVVGTAELAGVHVRFPLLDYRLVELAGRIPTSLKLKGFEKRYIFKQAMRDILPPKVLYKKKHGFGVPLGQWLLQNPRLNELLRDLLSDAHTRQRGYFRPEFFDHVVRMHQQDHVGFYGEVLWYLLVLELWHREHLERQGVACAS